MKKENTLIFLSEVDLCFCFYAENKFKVKVFFFLKITLKLKHFPIKKVFMDFLKVCRCENSRNLSTKSTKF